MTRLFCKSTPRLRKLEAPFQLNCGDKQSRALFLTGWHSHEMSAEVPSTSYCMCQSPYGVVIPHIMVLSTMHIMASHGCWWKCKPWVLTTGASIHQQIPHRKAHFPHIAHWLLAALATHCSLHSSQLLQRIVSIFKSCFIIIVGIFYYWITP